MNSPNNYSPPPEHQRLLQLCGLTAGVAHDLNNLFTSMLSLVDILYERADEPAQRQLQLLERTIDRAGEMTDSVLALIKQKPIPPVPIDPLIVVEELTSFLQPSLGDRLELTLPLFMEQRYVLMQPSQLGQILLNLIMNARDVSEANSPIHVSASFLCSTCPHPFELAVQDYGPGIEESKREEIFQPFFSTKESTGLGLTIIKTIVDQAGGAIHLDSKPGEGTTFRIALPEYAGDSATP